MSIFCVLRDKLHHVDGDITIRKTDRNGNVKPLTVKTGSYSVYGKEHFENATFKLR